MMSAWVRTLALRTAATSRSSFSDTEVMLDEPAWNWIRYWPDSRRAADEMPLVPTGFVGSGIGGIGALGMVTCGAVLVSATCCGLSLRVSQAKSGIRSSSGRAQSQAPPRRAPGPGVAGGGGAT